MKWHHNTTLLVVVCLAGLGASVAIVALHRQSPTSRSKDGWLTYENNQYGFTFEYPPAWAKILERSASAIDFMPRDSSRVFVAIYSRRPLQDFDARVDVYEIPLRVVLTQNPFLKHERQVEDVVIDRRTWAHFIGTNDTYRTDDYLTESGGRTYEIAGQQDLADQIVTTINIPR